MSAPNATRASEQEGTGHNRITAEILRTERGETIHRYTVDGRTYESLEALEADTEAETDE
ncbi:hypothetical protein HKX41_12140 [Salinisphaera sp. USBA-960]|nr:hypothetical protein [Salifodinibacter halophilus]